MRIEIVGPFGPVVAFTTTSLIRLLELCNCLRSEDKDNSDKEIVLPGLTEVLEMVLVVC